MKKILSVLMVFMILLSLGTITSIATEINDVDADAFKIYISDGASKVTISWDEVADADYYEVSITTDVEYHCVKETVKGLFYNWTPDGYIAPEKVYEIVVYAYDSEDLMIAQSYIAQANVYPVMCDDIVMYGDIDGDRNISVVDATMIQSFLADIIEFDDLQRQQANVNDDSYISVMDCTYIQRFCAEIGDYYNKTSLTFWYGWMSFDVVCDQWWLE